MELFTKIVEMSGLDLLAFMLFGFVVGHFTGILSEQSEDS